MIDTFSTILGGAGLGVLIQITVQHLLARKATRQDRRFEERKEAYSCFLEALLKLKSDSNTDENEVMLLYWASRVQLVCSLDVFKILEHIRMTGKSYATDKITIDTLVIAMRQDLDIAS